MVNPYLMGTALLKAMDDGIDNELDPGEAEERNIYDAIDAGKQVKKLPMSLGDALEELRNDEVIKSSMPGDMYRVYEHYKRTNGKGITPQSPIGILQSTSTFCRNSKFELDPGTECNLPGSNQYF